MTRVIMLVMLLLFLAGCTAPAYTPDPTTLAEREAQEYQRRVDRATWAWRIGLAAVTVLLAILCGLVFALSQVRYRVAVAKAAEEEAKARRALLVSISSDTFYDIKTGVLHRVNGVPMPANIPPIMPAQVIKQATDEQKRDEPLHVFVLDAANIAGWHSKEFPHWREWPRDDDGQPTMTGDLWKKKTDQLVEGGYLNPKQERVKNTVAEGEDLLWIHTELTKNGNE